MYNVNAYLRTNVCNVMSGGFIRLQNILYMRYFKNKKHKQKR